MESIKLKTNGFGVFMHVCAALAVVRGIFNVIGSNPETVFQQNVLTISDLHYTLTAIFF